MAKKPKVPLNLDENKRVVLLLQGGGALGAYQVGAYEVLQGRCMKEKRKIDWVAGISIGAINAAIIAGNNVQALMPAVVDKANYEEDNQLVPGDRPSKLEQLWDKITWPPYSSLSPFEKQFDSWLNMYSSLLPWSPLAQLLPKYAGWNMAAWGGQRNFFKSRLCIPWCNPWIVQWDFGSLGPDALANYSVGPLRDTLNELVDWDMINNAPIQDRIQLSLGATQVKDAEVFFFNSFLPDKQTRGTKAIIRADHVLASGALPPAFPAVCIDQDYYWDGGISSNTPLFDLRNEFRTSACDTIVFDILVWDRQGSIPKTMDELMWRQKCIQFGSRKKMAELIVENYEQWAQKEVSKEGNPGKLEIVQVMYEYENQDEAGKPVFWCGDAEFSRSSFEKLRRMGRKDMFEALKGSWEIIAAGKHAILYRHGSQDKHLSTDP